MELNVVGTEHADLSGVSVEQYEDRDSWLIARQSGIGGSEIAAVLGISPWLTPLALWAHKRGLAPPVQETRRMKRGQRGEEMVCREYAEETGREVIPIPTWTIYRSRERPWMFCTPDRFVRDLVRGRGVLEAKTARESASEEWSAAAPRHYEAQLRWQLAVLALPWGSLAALFGFSDFKYLDIERDPALEAAMIGAGEEFMGSVRSGAEPDARAGDAETVRRLFPRETPADSVTLAGDALVLDSEITLAERRIEEWEERRDAGRARLAQMIGDHERGVLANGVTWTNKTETRNYPAKGEWKWAGRVLRRSEKRQRSA